MKSPQGSNAAILGLAFITFVIIFGLIGFYQGIEVGEADRAEIAAQTHHENTAEQIEKACVSADLAAFRVCVEEAIQTSGEYQRAERDLAAQKNMATYAKWLLALSVFTTVVTAFGVWFVKITLDETRKAVKSADDAVGATREIGEAQIRPYLSIRTQMNGCPPRDKLETPCSMGLEIANSGVSLAKVLEIRAVSFIAPVPLPPMFEIPTRGEIIRKSGIVSPSLPLETGADVAPMSAAMAAEVTRFTEGKQYAIHVYASVLYKGVSSDSTYRTTYCANLIYTPDGVFVATNTQHNDAT